MSNENFEFTDEQNTALTKLSNRMKFTAMLFIFLGIIIGIFCGFTILKYPIRGISYLILTIMAIVFGVWTNNVSYSFKQIAETSGKEINILIEAFKVLKQVYTLQIIGVIIMIIILLVTLFLNAIFGTAITIFNTK